MKKKINLLLALAIAIPLGACGGNDEPGEVIVDGYTKSTALGGTISYNLKKNPSNDVHITLSREKNILVEGDNRVNTSTTLLAGDLITIESDYRYVYFSLTNFTETILYLPYGVATFQVPDVTSETCYYSKSFGFDGNFEVICRKATDEEIKTRRALTHNPYDHVLTDEICDYTAETSTQVDSVSIKNDDVYMFPHAYSNRVTRGEANFYARNAIDGCLQNTSHGSYPYQSWGYDQKTDAEYVIYFGREVNIDQISIWLRSDVTPKSGVVHDNYWKTCKASFSDNSFYTLNFKQSGNEQIFTFPSKTTSYIRLSGITNYEISSENQGYCALTEIKAYGSEDKTNEPVLLKTYKTSLGGKSLDKAKCTSLHASDIANVINATNDAFVNITETTTFEVPNSSGNPMQIKADSSDWRDAVYYGALSDYYFSTGRDKDAIILRGTSQNLGYKVNGGGYTPHSDYILVSEPYLYVNDYAGGAYKINDVLRNANYNINRTDPNDLPTDGLVTSYEACDEAHGYRADWTNMCFWWCDALYMSLNTYALLYKKTGNKAYVEKAYAGYDYFRNTSSKSLYNSEYNLWYRDHGRKSETTTSGKIAFWARGNAWVLAALAKQLLYIDEKVFPEIYETYKQDFIAMASSLIQYQRDDGTWNASIIDPEYCAGREMTGTCGFIYAICVGLQLGILDAATYMPVVEKAYSGMTSCIINVADGGKYDNQVGYMQTTGFRARNYKNETFSKPITHEFGMGLFIMAATQIMRMCSDYQQPSVRILPSGR